MIFNPVLRLEVILHELVVVEPIPYLIAVLNFVCMYEAIFAKVPVGNLKYLANKRKSNVKLV